MTQLRNGCPRSGNGLLDNFYVDRRTAQVWIDITDKAYIKSERLARLRQYILNRR
jgi:hypothetical protein